MMSDVPRTNEIVHGAFENGLLSVPRLIRFDKTSVTIHGLPDDVGEKLMELRTLNVDHIDGEINSIEFEFVRMADI